MRSDDDSGKNRDLGTSLPPAFLKIEILPAQEQKLFRPEHIRVKELCNSDLHPGVSVCLARVEPGVTTGLHWLEVDEIQYVVSGRGRIELDGNAFEVGAGWEIRIPRGTPQRISKTALNAETRVLASALKNTNIVANCVSPGWVKTRMGGPNAPDTPQQGVQAILWPATVEAPPTGGFFFAGSRIDFP